MTRDFRADIHLVNDLATGFVPGVASDFAEASVLMDCAARDDMGRFGEAQASWQRLCDLLGSAMSHNSKVMYDTADALLDASLDFVDTDSGNAEGLRTHYRHEETLVGLPHSPVDHRAGKPQHTGLGDFS